MSNIAKAIEVLAGETRVWNWNEIGMEWTSALVGVSPTDSGDKISIMYDVAIGNLDESLIDWSNKDGMYGLENTDFWGLPVKDDKVGNFRVLHTPCQDGHVDQALLVVGPKSAKEAQQAAMKAGYGEWFEDLQE
ncbi:MAG: hypothetical protein WC444_04720 [Candidatus Paceibacterota bacterium]